MCIRDRQEIVLFVETRGTLPPRRFNMELKKYIPQYMLPSKMVTVEQLPHTANDKIDRVKPVSYTHLNPPRRKEED